MFQNKEILVSKVALEHALFPDVSAVTNFKLFLTKNDAAEKAALWKQVRSLEKRCPVSISKAFAENDS